MCRVVEVAAPRSTSPGSQDREGGGGSCVLDCRLNHLACSFSQNCANYFGVMSFHVVHKKAKKYGQSSRCSRCVMPLGSQFLDSLGRTAEHDQDHSSDGGSDCATDTVFVWAQRVSVGSDVHVSSCRIRKSGEQHC